jgi:hypothetical protein
VRNESCQGKTRRRPNRDRLRGLGADRAAVDLSAGVICAIFGSFAARPLSPQQRRKSRHSGTAALDHERTHAAQQLATYSITSSARASTVDGISRPSAFAGRSAGFSPLRMRSKYPVASRSALRDGHAVDLDIERTGPLRDAEEDSGRRVLGK